MGAKFHVWVQFRAGRRNLSLEWIDPETGKRKQTSAGTADRAEAERKAIELAVKLEHRLHDHSNGMRWERFRALYREEHLAGLREPSREFMEIVLDIFERAMKPRGMTKLRERAIGRFASYLRQRKSRSGAIGLSPRTINAYLTAVKSALKWAAKQKIIGSVPEFPRIKVPKKRPQPILQEHFDALLAAAASPEWRAYLLCGWWAGLRLSEAKSLRWKPNKLLPYVSEGRIFLPAEFAKSCQDDWMPLHPTLAAAIAEVPVENDWVFPTIASMTSGAVSVAVKRLAKRAGVPLTMHRLRKGFGCRVAKQLGKGDTPVLHRMMRHTSMQLTMSYYASVDDALEDRMKELK